MLENKPSLPNIEKMMSTTLLEGHLLKSRIITSKLQININIYQQLENQASLAHKIRSAHILHRKNQFSRTSYSPYVRYRSKNSKIPSAHVCTIIIIKFSLFFRSEHEIWRIWPQLASKIRPNLHMKVSASISGRDKDELSKSKALSEEGT